MSEATETPNPATEADPRFPSGPWTGFFLEKNSRTDKQWMELDLRFASGKLSGDGRDYIGRFVIQGRYETSDGKCSWTKHYVGKHKIAYTGFNEGKGIWGLWEFHDSGLRLSGGFHIWPVAMGDPTREKLATEVDEPAPTPVEWVEAPTTTPVEVAEPVGTMPDLNATRGR
jgi:hypothetical protein